ncbi:hypothetical protein [Carboxylicivirga caseinilyticus]|uniref:hypothetical protein n=1 Tax=Carboxylicivirga caseinilyticus TaxID=3417572 RepID=UPI003D34B6D0|nr:hypothetical protein [Marinilabiliaceae bacterium A049]
MTDIKNSAIAGIVFGVLFGTFLGLFFDIKTGIIFGLISGLIFGVTIYLFITSKTVKKQTQIAITEDTEIIHSGGANHLKNGEGVGGKLYLLKDNLQFKSHQFNVQNHSLSIDLKDITEISFYNSLGIIPNGLIVHTSNGIHEKFVVNGRRIWKEEIEKHIKVVK